MIGALARWTYQIRFAQNHRDIWEQLYENPDLHRIFDADRNAEEEPITANEELFVLLLILHLNTSFYARQKGVLAMSPGIERDVREFISLAIPNAIWQRMKAFQDTGFVDYVDGIIGVESKG